MGKITLRGARISAGYTQDELAKKIDISRSVISDWESGKTEIKTAYLYALCYVTGFSPDDFLLPEKSSKCEPSEGE